MKGEKGLLTSSSATFIATGGFSPGFTLPASSLSEPEDLCTIFFKDAPVLLAVALKSDSTEKKIPLMLKIFTCYTWLFIFVVQFTLH